MDRHAGVRKTQQLCPPKGLGVCVPARLRKRRERCSFIAMLKRCWTLRTKFPVCHRRVTRCHPAAVASVRLCLVPLDLCNSFKYLISRQFNVTKKGVFLLCASSFLAVIIWSQMRDFLFVQGYYGSSFRGK